MPSTPLNRANKELLLFQKFHTRFNEYKTIYVVPDQYTGPELLNQLGIRTGPPVILFKEGDVRFGEERLERTICEGIAYAAAELRASVVDRGTNMGWLGLLNTALRERHHPGLYIGVAPRMLTHLPNQPSHRHLTTLGDAHTHFVLVEGDHWGAELSTINTLIKALVEKTSFLVISVKGGKGKDAKGEESSEESQKTVRTAGFKSLADSISLQLCYPGSLENSSPVKLSREEVFSVTDLYTEPEKLTAKIKYYLKTYAVNK